MNHYLYTKKDLIFALCSSFVIIIIAACRLTTGYSVWEDDPAAYMNEGIAISEGRFWEQAKINYYYHPSTLPTEAKNNQLIYVWGYPLLLAIVNRFVGFDRVLYNTIIYYKIPNVICVGLLAATAFLFFRRRFSFSFSAALAILLSMNDEFIKWVNITAPDLWLMVIGLSSFLLLECYLDQFTRNGIPDVAEKSHYIKRIIIALLFGGLLWYAHELRLNGSTIALTCALGHMVYYCRHPEVRCRKTVLWGLLPYFFFLVLTWITERILAGATRNISDYSRASFDAFFRHCVKQMFAIYYFFTDLFGMISSVHLIRIITSVLMMLCAIGFLTVLKREPHLALLALGSFFITAMLPYGQGIRYIFNILPILVLSIGYGFETVLNLAKFNKKNRRVQIAEGVFIVLLLVSSVAKQIFLARENLKNWRTPEGPVYSEAAIEMYGFIQNNLAKDAIIEFSWPRSLFLNTQRKSFRQNVNGHTAEEADFSLHIKSTPEDNPIAGNEENLKVVFENSEFMLTRIEQ